MLPIVIVPKDRVAAHECVEGDTKGPDPTAAKVWFAVDLEVLGTYHKGTYVMYPYLRSHYGRVLVVIRHTRYLITLRGTIWSSSERTPHSIVENAAYVFSPAWHTFSINT